MTKKLRKTGVKFLCKDTDNAFIPEKIYFVVFLYLMKMKQSSIVLLAQKILILL